MKKIYKYSVPDPIMPTGAEILSAQLQNNEVCVWALVDDEEPEVTRILRVIGTGWTFDPSPPAKYVGTVQQGQYVWHIFDQGEVPAA